VSALDVFLRKENCNTLKTCVTNASRDVYVEEVQRWTSRAPSGIERKCTRCVAPRRSPQKVMHSGLTVQFVRVFQTNQPRQAQGTVTLKRAARCKGEHPTQPGALPAAGGTWNCPVASCASGHRRSQGGLGDPVSPKCLAYLVILYFEKRCPKRKYRCPPKVKHFSPAKFWAGYATASGMRF